MFRIMSRYITNSRQFSRSLMADAIPLVDQALGHSLLVVLPPGSNTSTAIPQKLNVKSNKRRDSVLMRLSSSGLQSTSRKEPLEKTTAFFSPLASALGNKHLSLRFDDRIPFSAYVRVSYSLCLVCYCTSV